MIIKGKEYELRPHFSKRGEPERTINKKEYAFESNGVEEVYQSFQIVDKEIMGYRKKDGEKKVQTNNYFLDIKTDRDLQVGDRVKIKDIVGISKQGFYVHVRVVIEEDTDF